MVKMTNDLRVEQTNELAGVLAGYVDSTPELREARDEREARLVPMLGADGVEWLGFAYDAREHYRAHVGKMTKDAAQLYAKQLRLAVTNRAAG